MFDRLIRFLSRCKDTRPSDIHVNSERIVAFLNDDNVLVIYGDYSACTDEQINQTIQDTLLTASK